jgi:YedE family putative selenium metabolism protein
MERNRLLAHPAILVGGAALIGAAAGALELLGNPVNMGVCVVCFERDVAGALGLHRAPPVQYVRPEVPAILLGGLFAALALGRFRPRAGSAPLVRFLLGFFAVIGSLVFLGCTWRLGIRLAGADGTALFGLAGFLLGIGAGAWLQRRGHTLGDSPTAPAFHGWIMPVLMGLVLLAAIVAPSFGKTGVLFASGKGPGAIHAPLAISIIGGLVIGALAHLTGFCTIGWIRRSLFGGERRLLAGGIAFVLAAFVLKLIGGSVKPGFSGVGVIAHSDAVWNVLGMLLAGLAFTLAGGCPGRQLVAAGEGSADAGVFVLGSLAGAAAAHNFAMAAIPDKPDVVGGPGPWGQGAVIFGILFCVAVGLFLKRK